MGNEEDTQKLLHNRQYAREYYAKRKEANPLYNTGKTRPRSEKQWDWHLQNSYGITAEQVASLFETQGGSCAICGASLFDTCHVDHCHTSKKVRGLLCRQCNHGLGKFNDSTDILLNAIAYLESSI